MQIDSIEDDFDNDASSVQFSTRSPRHRSTIAPDRARSKRRNFRKRPSPNPIRGFAHRSNKRLSW
jgi:hypothetical protein